MKALTFLDAKRNLSNVLEEVCQDHEPTIITRAGGEAVVLISLEEYSSLEETMYLLQSPNNAKQLMESIAQLESGGGM
ncbi:antitoxin YefM [Desulfatibacillum alkenivorans DSM 16219]|jgi:antitoxin YefM|uniref:Antitoxin n=1 Tax=Desulfatibacillum alkenivorans DSM 16219 TaxID=1121393 RepID=A0A1M6MDI5_9BACT|nr:type II toxin-antitoxin system prevent-host-death family antitoxin [Desulfatibacillum alkenivorans]SHJ81489.1 antitoxin YefM [Desulfatibacillum alkenivorans DSM 16219]